MRRSPWLLVAPSLGLLVASSLPLACGGDTPVKVSASATETSSASDTGGTTSTTAAGTTTTGVESTSTTLESTTFESTSAESTSAESTTAEPPRPVECESKPLDHAVDCPEPGCPITVDVEVRCKDHGFLDDGMRVAASPKAIYAASAAVDAWYLFAADEDGAGPVPDPPEGFGGSSIFLAIDAEGRLHAAANEDGAPKSSSVVTLADGVWSKEPIFSAPDGDYRLLNLDFDADGIAHAWVAGLVTHKSLTRADDATWTPTPGTNPGVQIGFAVAADGSSVGLGVQESDSTWQVQTLINGVPGVLGEPLLEGPPSPRVLGFTPGLGVEAPAFVFAVQTAAHIALLWPEGDGYVQVELPDTAMPIDECPDLPLEPSCEPESCYEHGVGVKGREMALARTADGALWVAYAVSRKNQLVSQSKKCDENECWCELSEGLDQGDATLHLVRVWPQSQVIEPVLTLEVPVLEPSFKDGFGLARAIDLHAHGSTLALGLVRRGTGSPWIRMLRIETAAP
ncbi:MAG: hypothetical protein R3B09_02750 [Nannocystaceae bacterium]